MILADDATKSGMLLLAMAFVSGCRDPEKPKEPTPSTSFVPGPKIKPTPQLLEWLEKEAGSRKRIRIPVVIQFQDSYRLAIGRAFVGVAEADAESDPLFLHLDDSTMGIALIDTVRFRFPKDAQSAAVWLEGHWGPALPAAFLPPRGDRKPFTLRSVGEIIDPGSLRSEDARALIEAPR